MGNLLILFLLSLSSTLIMSYVSMATPIGPWISPTLVIFLSIFLKLYKIDASKQVLVIIGSSIGGILATALGFSLPTLFFLDPNLFKSWTLDPLFFSCFISILSLSAGLLGFWIANIFEERLIVEQNLKFPIGQLVYKMMNAHNQLNKVKQLIIGFISTIVFCFLQERKLGKFINIFTAQTYYFFKIPELRLDFFPTYWAIGYITGEIIIVPLLVGALSKIFIIDIINLNFFSNIPDINFMLAFCSGLVLSGVIFSLFDIAVNIWKSLKTYKIDNRSFKLSGWVFPLPHFNIKKIENYKTLLSQYHVFLLIVILFLNFLFLSFFGFSFFVQIYLLILTFLCTYQIISIAGKIGLAQLGRFATLVMVPAMFIFNLNFVQLTIIATYVEICGGIATDLLFGRKIGQLSQISKSQVKKYQFFGIIICSIIVGAIFWLIIMHFKLGSSELFAQRAQSRALLINVVSFDHYVLMIGFVFGLILKKMKINPMLTLGGLLMPFNISLGLILGGLIKIILRNKDYWESFWSGVFASHSIWMIINAII